MSHCNQQIQAGLYFYLTCTRKFGAISVDLGRNAKYSGLIQSYIKQYYDLFDFHSFCIIEGPETVQNFMQLQLQEIRDNIRSRRNKIFLLMEEVSFNYLEYANF